MILRNIFPILLCRLLGGGNYFRTSSKKPNTAGFDLVQVRQDMLPLDPESPYAPTEAIRSFFQFYDLAPTQTAHYFGTVISEDRTLATHAFIPPNPRGTLLRRK